MNQSILFSDNEVYNVDLQQIAFQAQCEGRLITCVISVEALYKLNELVPPIHNVLVQDEILALFESVRFDIEDLAEQMIAFAILAICCFRLAVT